MIKIYLSPSTQENNVGVNDYGTEEARMNTVADVTAKELVRAGQFTIYRNRPDMILNQVVADSDKIKPDAHVAIHSNAYNKTSRGALGLYYKDTSTTSYKLCKSIHDEILTIAGVSDNKMRYGKGLAEIDTVNATSTIQEVSFHDNFEDAQWIEDNIKNIGIAIAKGICKYFGAVYIPEPATATIGNGNKTFTDTGVVNVSGLNLRSAPDPNSTILGQFTTGDKLWLFENNNGWYRVYPDKTGWVKAEFVTIVIPIPTVSTQIYRVRKSWEDVKGQIAAYEDLTNAKERADLNVGYKVFDKDGNIVYTPIIIIPVPEPAPEIIIPEPTPIIVPIPIPEIVDADIKNMSISNILTKLLNMIKMLLEMLGQKNIK